MVRWALDKRVTVGFIVALCILVTIAGLSYRNTRRLVHTNAAVANTYQVLSELQATLVILNQAEAGRRGYVITGEEYHLGPYTEAAEQIHVQLGRLRGLITNDPAHRQRLAKVDQAVAEKLAVMEESIRRRKTQGLDTTVQAALTDRGDAAMGKIRGLIGEMENDERNMLAQRIEAVERSTASTNFIFLTGTWLGLLLLVLVFYLLSMEVGERKSTEFALERVANRVRDLYNNAPCGYHSLDDHGTYVEVNDTELRWLGYTREELLGKRQFPELLTEGSRSAFEEAFPRFIESGYANGLEFEVLRKDGTILPVLLNATAFKDPDGNFVASRATLIDNTERRQATEELRKAKENLEVEVAVRTAQLADANERLRCELAERKKAEEALQSEREFLRAVLHNMEDGILACNAEGALTLLNKAAQELHGLPELSLPARDWTSHFQLFSQDGKTPLAAEETPLRRALRGEGVRNVEVVIRPIEGPQRTLLCSGQAMAGPVGEKHGALLVLRDITEQKLMEQQFVQSQKIEAVGRLAGGVAHDFNNLLTIITGYSQLARDQLKKEDPLRPYVLEVLAAADRAASLTRQLLAFSRKQVLAPQVLDLNQIIQNLSKMLRRLIGEDIEVRNVLSPTLGRVRADPAQIEQIIINLALNARDAMPRGGKLIIETADADLNQAYANRHIAMVPGRYVMLAVADTGIGMDEETQAHIFEPFFTTKEKGKGTGLGLAMVYGTVKQSGGYIWVYSEPARGTTFKVYLPRVEDHSEPIAPRQSVVAQVPRGSETILLVEDEEAVRSMVRGLLETHGYRVFAADQAREVLQFCQLEPGTIHLLLTDVVMPRMSGRELAERVIALHPETRVLYMSGYTDDAIVHHGVLNPGVAFIQKPFTPDALMGKVREVLDG
ncbi:MAG: CHASE3 domain-containing protein [Acidobacteriia bacterium]|nr:CHASE3 domain-containing protein [Terriglobia bacterium]